MPFLLAPSFTSAAVHCVRPTGGSCHSTINAALFVAAPGDTIRVLPGVYRENVSLALENLRLIGAGPRATIIDSPIPMLSAAPVTISANRVELASLAIRNGGGDGVFVYGTSGVTIRNVKVFGSFFGAGVKADVSATTVSVIGCELVGGFAGVSMTGSNHGAIVRGNTIRQAQVGVELLADNVLVSGNRISSFRSYGIRVEGVRADVRDNVLDLGFEAVAAISVIGDEPAVLRNRVSNGGPLVVRCLTCAEARVFQNTVVGSATAFG
ncbi:MAG TPA: right-handed parallel beta-helix repeat-containing protein, partial [Vicinamibacteria bacterium]